MKNKKFKLSDLKVKSFTTSISESSLNTVKGRGGIPTNGCTTNPGTFVMCGSNPNCTVRTCLGEA